MEKSLIEKAKEVLVEKALWLWLGAIGTLLALVGNVILQAVLPTLSSPTIQKALLPILGLSILCNLSLLGYVWFQHRRWLRHQHQKMRKRFGILWDADLQPHCPACNSPVAYSRHYAVGAGCYCAKCEKVLFLSDDTGNQHILIEEARKLLSEKK